MRIQSSEANAMLKLNRIRKWHIPNAVAIAAALLLLVSSLISVEQPADPVTAPSLAASQPQDQRGESHRYSGLK